MPMWVWVYSLGHLFSVIFNFSADGWSTFVDAWLLYFPGCKVGQIHLYSSLLTTYAGGVDYKSWHSTEYDYSWARRLTGTDFLLPIFVFPSNGSLNISSVERLHIRPVFVPRNFVSAKFYSNPVQTLLILLTHVDSVEFITITQRRLIATVYHPIPHWISRSQA
jgi:hypothetical protein